MISEEQFKAMEAYLARVHEVVESLHDNLNADQRVSVEQLVNHGEPAEGLCTLAWIIVNENLQVPCTTIAAIRELSEGLVASEDMPPNLDLHILEQQ